MLGMIAPDLKNKQGFAIKAKKLNLAFDFRRKEIGLKLIFQSKKFS